ncbi:hypothetical protein ID871_32815 [Streptomyces pratensis]|nr:hypothetical protein [Streptomyces pratensis]
MTEHLPQEEKVVNQTNSGPGTFVGGNVFGHIYNFFVPAQRQRPSSTPAGQDSRAVGEGDYDDIFGSLFGAVFLGGTFAGGLVYAARGLPFAKDAPAPDVLERLAMGSCSASHSLRALPLFWQGPRRASSCGRSSAPISPRKHRYGSCPTSPLE